MAMPPNQVIHILREMGQRAPTPEGKAVWNDAADTVELLSNGWERTPFVPVQVDWASLSKAFGEVEAG